MAECTAAPEGFPDPAAVAGADWVAQIMMWHKLPRWIQTLTPPPPMPDELRWAAMDYLTLCVPKFATGHGHSHAPTDHFAQGGMPGCAEAARPGLCADIDTDTDIPGRAAPAPLA